MFLFPVPVVLVPASMTGLAALAVALVLMVIVARFLLSEIS